MTASPTKLVKKKLDQGGVSPLAAKNFLYQYDKLLRGETGLIPESEISPVKSAMKLSELESYRASGVEALKKLLVVKLNGGLGTSMGLSGAKSLLPAKNGLSFLDIALQQVLSNRERFKTAIPFVLMNSFHTESDSREILERYPELRRGNGGLDLSFLQNKVPKISVATLTPAESPETKDLEWCPPGHGDLYPALFDSGLLEKALERGMDFLFVSNIDNLSSTLDERILGYLATERLDFLMEVCSRTAADRKGGHIAQRLDGSLVLREIAQCPAEDLESFQDYERYSFFNTNSLWLNLRSLFDEISANDGVLRLPLIRNRKRLDPRDQNSDEVYQLETAMGAALECFKRSAIVQVPRTRFTPVKTTNDLLELWSDVFTLDENFSITNIRSELKAKLVIDLDPKYFGRIDDFEKRFPFGSPSLVECDSLQVKGNWHFGRENCCRGEVELEGEGDLVYCLADRAELSGKITAQSRFVKTHESNEV
ncbi:MAG: UTP--glucose-1-phosphate uridylyltransferase [Bdellovibrionales bacterium]|nr:UTP--glucose-1-phosphate uridylyltransferase [Bdellovibrionales bacterium]